jgi:very-short-patch-repair endonuclease
MDGDLAEMHTAVGPVGVHERSPSAEKIDLFCAVLKLAIEIDGPQHLADPAAYRSDRRKDARTQGRKDALLQENGCHVLRFLAEDLGKHLDATLDAILRAITHLRRKY